MIDSDQHVDEPRTMWAGVGATEAFGPGSIVEQRSRQVAG